MDLAGLGWRDGLLLAAGLVAVYLVVSVLHLIQLRRRRPTLSFVPAAPAAPTAAAAADAPAPAAPFAEHLARTGLEAEVARLREEVAALRDELAAVRAAPRVSPLYTEAMALARRGFDARGIAHECGISVAEAELVLAMSCDNRSFDDEVDHGGNGPGIDVAGR